MMTGYITLLRGINVGGHKKIRMVDLRLAVASLGFKNVSAYIQSGNLIFDSKLENEAEVEESVSTLIKDRFGFDVPTIARKESSFGKIVSHCPINTKLLSEKDEILISLLSKQPEELKWEAFKNYFLEKENVKNIFLKGRSVYFLRKKEKRDTKFSNNFLENRLKVVATTRNWKTIVKLHDMCEAKSD